MIRACYYYHFYYFYYFSIVDTTNTITVVIVDCIGMDSRFESGEICGLALLLRCILQNAWFLTAFHGDKPSHGPSRYVTRKLCPVTYYSNVTPC